MLATELIEEPVARASEAMEGDAPNSGVIRENALKRAHEEEGNGKGELAEIAKAHDEMKKTRTKKNNKLREEHVYEVAARKVSALESEKTFGRELDEAVSNASLRTAECDSANARYHEVLAALRRIGGCGNKRKICRSIISRNFWSCSTKVGKLQCQRIRQN